MPSPFSFATQLLLSPFTQHLSRGDGPADLTAALPRVQSGLNGGLSLLDVLGGLGQDQLNVARVRHVWVDLFFC